ncbi:Thiazolylpeptide-type bacteriocin [Cohnella lubricantis]|uniref:Uncharacterized protein n=1 Tax=Cohnella lubricantis TaxID=2163172 RepID=A0A841TC18_9BACL|nr:hypothetical protein [Cohnella lubricantis]MBB6676918.1 hypothetical protein [Cohnella lubricantis]MBP2118320.1 hypothetical protein [Cohnella lubricantis]
MTNFMKRIVGVKTENQSACCGVEIKEVSEGNAEAISSSCCGTETSATADSACCGTDTSASSASSCCG